MTEFTLVILFIRTFMEQNKISGVYKIINNITGDFYIGSSKNIKQRWTCHKSPYKWEQKPGMKLYQAMIQYGRDNFTIEIIEETNNLKEREQYWIGQLKPSYNTNKAYTGIEGRKELKRQCSKAWRKAHKDKRLAYYKTNRDKHLARNRAYNNRLCIYYGETLKFGALSCRFHRLGITNPAQEAKKYLIERSI